MNKQRGFTIIELIVVIAIIAILAAIVLVNVSQYINKAHNSAIISDVVPLIANGALYFSGNASAHGLDFCSDTNLGPANTRIISGVTSNGVTFTSAANCWGNPTTQNWCVFASTLAVGSTAAGTYCVDSTGFSGKVTDSGAQCALTGGADACCKADNTNCSVGS